MPGTNLTQEEAATRAALLEVEHYDIDLDLTTGGTFRTRTRLTFRCSTPGTSTFIDFVGPSVESITLNGRTLDPAQHVADGRIALPDLAADNVLEVDATGAYTNTGIGLHRFVDPVDDQAYVYSQFEVADTRRAYAVFEQPDLKATYTFHATVPDHWKVISNAFTPEPTALGDGLARWDFPTTERMSPYVTALVAGPYEVVHDSVTTRTGELPLAIYCRRSMRSYLDAEELFDITKRGFEFFENEFDFPYPFGKYDQIFTPEFNAGAMENAGCVTIAETYVFRGRVREQIIERRALTILHELAHMWFGDLVTMRWWDDLWLNESFAEWAATTAQAEATRWTDAWATFGSYEKEWALRQDQLSTTHPVRGPMRDIEEVLANFDGITYAKGASSLKQLVAFVGRETFITGLRRYFKDHAWGNTTLPDLLGALEDAGGHNLDDWNSRWLLTSGVNTLRPALEVDADGVITSAVIEQSFAEGYPTLRPHRLAVGLYAEQDGRLTRTDLIEVDVDGERTQVPALVGLRQPDLLLVNDLDLTYAKVRLDERSLATALAHPRGFSDAIAQMLVATIFWDMVRDGELPATTFVEQTLELIDGLHDATLLTTRISRMQDSTLPALQTALLGYTDPARRDALRASTVERLHALALAAEPGTDAQFQLLTAWLELLGPGDDTAFAQALLAGTEELPGLPIDQDLRWQLVIGLAAAGVLEADDIEQERLRDNTVAGNEFAAKARAARPTPEAKEQAWAAAVVEDGLPRATIEAIGKGFARSTGPELTLPFVERFHDALIDAAEHRAFPVVEEIVQFFYPGAIFPTQATFEATQAWLDAHPDAPSSLVRLMTMNRDLVARALDGQAADTKA